MDLSISSPACRPFRTRKQERNRRIRQAKRLRRRKLRRNCNRTTRASLRQRMSRRARAAFEWFCQRTTKAFQDYKREKSCWLAWFMRRAMAPLLSLGLIGAAQANTVLVTTDADVKDGDTSNFFSLHLNKGPDGKISLREAIETANNHFGHDTIIFHADLNGSTLRLTQGEMPITSDILITGPGELNLTISGDADSSNSPTTGDSRIFSINSGTVTMSGLTLDRGNFRATDASVNVRGGGAIDLKAGATLIAENVTFTNNTVSSDLAGNHGGGGAILSRGQLTLNNVTLGNNLVDPSNHTNATGGAIDHDTGSVAISGGSMDGNSAGVLSLLDGGANGKGGALFLRGGAATLDGVKIGVNADNKAHLHGANISSLAGSQLVMKNTRVVGGARDVFSSSPAEGTRSLHLKGVAELLNSTIYNSTNVGGVAAFGNLKMVNSTLAGNRSSLGGGLYLASGANAEMLQSTITACQATNASPTNGHGVEVSAGASLTLTNSIVAGNGSLDTNRRDIGGAGTISYAGKNIFGSAGLGGAGDIIETDASKVFRDSVNNGGGVNIGILAENGGLVPTIMPLFPGPAIDVAVGSSLPVDTQDLDKDADIAELLPVDARGMARVVRAADIGAVENETAAPVITSITAPPTPVNQLLSSITFTVTFDKAMGTLNPTDFQVTGGTTATVTQVTTSDNLSYVVTVSGGDLQQFSTPVGIAFQPVQDLGYTFDTSAVPPVNQTFQQITSFLVTTATDEGVSAPNSTDLAAEAADGTGLSLREAIDIANALPGAQTINFDSSVFSTPQTMRLAVGSIKTRGPIHGYTHYSHTLEIKGDLTINGPGAANFTISGDVNGDGKNSGHGSHNELLNTNKDCRVLDVHSGTVVIKGIDVHAGTVALVSTRDDVGGGLRVLSGANVHLENVVVRDCHAGDANYGSGGGVANFGTLSMLHTTVRHNSAKVHGGGILNRGMLTMAHSKVHSNSNFNRSGVYRGNRGGGIYSSGELLIEDSAVYSNKFDAVNYAVGAYSYGVGISSKGNLTLRRSSVHSNSIGLTNYRTTAAGVGIHMDGTGKLTLQQSVVSSNGFSTERSVRNSGGGIFIGSSNTAEIVNSQISDNSGGGALSTKTLGGGIANQGALVLTNSTVHGNRLSQTAADSHGAGIHNTGTLTVQQSTLTGNRSALKGGAIYSVGGALTVTNSIIAGNQGDSDATTNDIGGTTVPSYTGVNLFATTGTGDSEDIVEADVSKIFANTATLRRIVNGHPVDDITAGALADNGGGVKSVLPNPAGPASNTGDAAALPADTLDLDGDGDTSEPLPLDVTLQSRLVKAVDIGAVEDQTVSPVSLISIRRKGIEYGVASSLEFTVSFDEAVSGVDVADFVVTGGSTATVTRITTTDNRVFTITVSGGDLATFSGRVGLDVAAGVSIQAQDDGQAVNTGEPNVDETYTNGLVVTTATDERADSINVSMEGADGTGLSLREAIDIANALPGAQTINFDSGVFSTPQTMRLAVGSIKAAGAIHGYTHYSHTLEIKGDLTINGPGAANLTISGDVNGDGQNNGHSYRYRLDTNKDCRVLDVHSGTVVIKGIDVHAGAAYLQSVSDDLGAGLRVLSGASVHLENVVVRDCLTGGGNYGLGGGIANLGTLSMLHTTVRRNRARLSGGGVFNRGTLTMAHSKVHSNSNEGFSSASRVVRGGGIYSRGELLIEDSAVYSNILNSNFQGREEMVYGAGISSTMDNLTLRRSAVFSNQVNNVHSLTTAAGGGIHMDDTGKLTLQQSVVSSNGFATERFVRNSGGGIFIGSSNTAEIVNSQISDNSGGGTVDTKTLGGGIANQGALVLTNSTVHGNRLIQTTADSHGAGIHNTGTLTVQQSTLTGNRSALKGGAIYSVGGALTVTNSIIAGNQGDNDATTNDIGGTTVPSFTGVNLFATTGTGDSEDIVEADVSKIFNTVVSIHGITAGGHTDNGGGVRSVLPNPTGPATNTGDAAALPADTLDLDGDGDTSEPLPLDVTLQSRLVKAVDIGAVEDQTVLPFALTSIERHSPASLQSLATSFVFKLNFTEPVAGVDVADFVVTGGSTATVTSVASISSKSYLVTVSGGNLSTYQGYINLDLVSNVSITAVSDGAALPNTAPAVSQPFIRGFLHSTVSTLDDEVAATTDLATEMADGNGLSLREAVAVTGATGVVQIDPSLTGTLILTQGEIMISNDLTISGPALDSNGKPTLTLSGDADGSNSATIGDSRIFRIAAGTVSLSNLTLDRGFYHQPAYIGRNRGGGALYAQSGTTVSLSDVCVSNSVLTTGVLSNYAAGAGIYAQGNLSLERVEVLNNKIGSSFAGTYGGGLCHSGGSLSITDSRFENNESSSIIFPTNHRTGRGGGMWLKSGGSLMNVTVANNKAELGGGIFAFGQVTMDGCLVSHNSADVNGAYDNTAGGGIRTSGTFTISNSLLLGNKSNGKGHGAGIWNSGNLTMINTTIENSHGVRRGGALYGAEGSNTTLHHCTVTGNSATSQGAGFHVANGAVTMNNSILAGNVNLATSQKLEDLTGNVTLTTRGKNIFSQAGLGDAQDIVAADLTQVFETTSDLLTFKRGVSSNNGGSLLTVQIKAGGLAHEAGDNSTVPPDINDVDKDGNVTEALPLDARGGIFTRVQGTVDIGAVEHNGPFLTAPTGNPITLSENSSIVAHVTASDPITQGGAVSFALVGGGVDNAKFQIVNGNELQFITAPDAEAPTDANTDNTYHLTLLMTGATGEGRFVALEVKILNVAESPYETWVLSFYPGVTDQNVVGANANPSGDGSNNLIKYGFGLNPTVSSGRKVSLSGLMLNGANGVGLPRLHVTPLQQGVDFGVVFTRRKDFITANLGYTVEFSHDLTNWFASSDTPTVLDTTTSTEVDLVSVPYPMFVGPDSKKPRFYRVGVIQN